jgi:exodeoxyribonuclease VII small subunit
MAKKAEEFDYREKADELERIIMALQDPAIQIDEATKLHAAGLRLVSEMEAYLNQAEIVVKKHVADAA